MTSSISTQEAATIFISKLSNATSSIGKLVIPSLALAATAFLTHTMALTQLSQQHSPPSLLAAGGGAASASFSSLTRASSKIKSTDNIPSNIKNLHVVVLVHGWLGSPSEMSSIQQALETEIQRMSNKSCGDSIDIDADNNSNNNNSPENNDNLESDDSSSLASEPTAPLPEQEEEEEREKRIIPDDTMIYVHSVECNGGKGKTTDGVLAGGSRVADEVNQLIQDLLLKAKNDEIDENNDRLACDSGSGGDSGGGEPSIRLSFIGNSLGGLYARSALASLNWNLPNGNTVKPCIFVTTATPHLGKRGQTYIRIPRMAEQGIGLALKPTGADLFGLNNVIENLATQKKYLDPLKRFQKRIAYANAFGTDLQVPTATAAFLSDTESPHYTQETKPPFLLTVTTPQDENLLASMAQATTITSSSSSEDDDDDDKDSSSKTMTTTTAAHIPASTMARTLDALGWTKIFCDVRHTLISVPVPFKGEESSSEFKAQDAWTSHELKAAVASRIFYDKKWPIPFGHTMLIANAKSELYAKLNQGGKPFVQQLAADFLDDILEYGSGDADILEKNSEVAANEE